MTSRPEGELLLVVDVQNDFCPGGQLAVAGGDAVVPVINRLQGRFRHIAYTQDWHPADHHSFASQHPGRAPYDRINLSYGPQTLWPDHCVQGSHGAAFHPGLETDRASVVIRKGMRREIDSYSAFLENDRTTPTGLSGVLEALSVHRIVVTGLALDFCVAWSALDARRHGCEVAVVEDATRPVDLPGTVDAAMESLREHGIEITTSQALLA